jgi:hypothetical protein
MFSFVEEDLSVLSRLQEIHKPDRIIPVSRTMAAGTFIFLIINIVLMING